MAEAAVLDASAVLALLRDEAGAAQVAGVLPTAAISAVNLAEVLVVLERKSFVVGESVRFEMRLPAEQGGALVQIDARIVRDDPRTEAMYGIQFVKARTRDHNLVCKVVIVKQFEDRRAELREVSERSENR